MGRWPKTMIKELPILGARQSPDLSCCSVEADYVYHRDS